MASLIPNVPVEFMHPSQKYALMNWLSRQMGLPGRIAAQVLQQWGAEMYVELWPTDFDLVRNRMIVTTAQLHEDT